MKAVVNEKADGKQKWATAAAVLSHPLRVRILEVLNEKDMSPSEFVQSGLAPERPTLSMVAYHFKTLWESGCLEIVGEVKVRGAVEHTYRGTSRAFFSDEDWAELADDQRRRISKVMWQGMAARVDGAFLADTFDARLDRHLTWLAMDLDEQGWDELTSELEESFSRVLEIRAAAAQRLKETAEIPVHVTMGMLGFESPRTVDVVGVSMSEE
jgi:hypothetical protein